LNAIVLDTNIVLDLCVFRDPAVEPLRHSLDQRVLQWIATPPMREELARVLAYPQLIKSLNHHQTRAADVLARFDAQVCMVEVAAKAAFTCKDADDQKFIDLAVAHRAALVSKDHAVLCMARRLRTLGVAVQAVFSPEMLVPA